VRNAIKGIETEVFIVDNNSVDGSQQMLKSKFPDFTKPLEHLYRGGRSLGIFVVLMTQSPSGIVTDQMRNNAEFRWCLSVKSDADSRELL
jgi:S-DNA-T family DNA segregation ATPase FtsK/SpoIIIE